MEHDVLSMIEENSLKTRVIIWKLASFDRIRWTLHAERKNMCVSVRNNDVFSKKPLNSRISPTEQDILGTIDENSCYSVKSGISREHSLNSTSWALKLVSFFEQ